MLSPIGTAASPARTTSTSASFNTGVNKFRGELSDHDHVTLADVIADLRSRNVVSYGAKRLGRDEEAPALLAVRELDRHLDSPRRIEAIVDRITEQLADSR